MAIQTRQKCDHVLVDVQGDMRMDKFVVFRKDIESLMHGGAKHIDFNLSSTNFIDSSNLRFLINVKNRLASKGGSVCLVAVQKMVRQILENTNLTKVFLVFETESDYDESLLKQSKPEEFDFWSVAEPSSGPIRRVPLKCPVCQSIAVCGFVLSPDNRKLVWLESQFMPVNPGADQDKDADFDRVRVAVCSKCFLASVDLSHFDVMKGDQVIRPSNVDKGTISHLSRSAAKRKKMVEVSEALLGDFFRWPRTDKAVLASYCLAKDCAENGLVDSSPVGDLRSAYLSIMLAENVPEQEEEACFVSARARLTKALESPESLTESQTAEAYYYLFITCLRLDKKKEAGEALQKFNRFAGNATDSLSQNAIRFWLDQAEHIWQAVQDE